MQEDSDFYLRYYVGHKGRFGHEFLEFEFRSDGRLRYANNTNYRNEPLIRKEVYVNPIVIEELKNIVKDSRIVHEYDENWPEPNKNGRQELEVVLSNRHICFVTSKIGSFNEIQQSSDPEGLRSFYYLVQDLKCLVFSIITLHFRVKPV